MSEKFIIYQLLPRLGLNLNDNCVPDGDLSRNGSGRFSDIDVSYLRELKKLSVSHIWLTGILDHATQGDEGVKGKAGSPYAIRNYYQVAPYLCEHPENGLAEFDTAVSRIHHEGLKLIIDFVPNHLARCYREENGGFSDINFYPGRIHDGDWTDTVKLNYTERDTWNRMRDILFFWASRGVDGFRCDMVELVPVEFWAWCIPEVKRSFPSLLFIAEIYQPSNYDAYLYRGGFDFLYDKSGFYDHLRAISRGEMRADALTGVWQALGGKQPRMLNFLENHDEQRIASDFFLGDPMKALPALYVSLYFNTAPFMIYFGQELGERGMEQEGFSGLDGKTSIFDFTSLSSCRRWLKGVREGEATRYLTLAENSVYFIYRKMLKDAVGIPALACGGVYDLEYVNPYSSSFDPARHFAFLRYKGEEIYLCAVNFGTEDAAVKIIIPDEAYDFIGVSRDDKPKNIELFISAHAGTLIRI